MAWRKIFASSSHTLGKSLKIFEIVMVLIFNTLDLEYTAQNHVSVTCPYTLTLLPIYKKLLSNKSA
jgi:hypothetical protein